MGTSFVPASLSRIEARYGGAGHTLRRWTEPPRSNTQNARAWDSNATVEERRERSRAAARTDSRGTNAPRSMPAARRKYACWVRFVGVPQAGRSVCRSSTTPRPAPCRVAVGRKRAANRISRCSLASTVDTSGQPERRYSGPGLRPLLATGEVHEHWQRAGAAPSGRRSAWYTGGRTAGGS